MPTISEIIKDPAAWLLGVGVGALLGVWWARMTPTQSNFTLIVGVLALAAAIFLKTSDQPLPVRLMWSVGTLCGVGLFVNYQLWHRDQNQVHSDAQAELSVPVAQWEEGDPLPTSPDFPISVRLDHRPLTGYNAAVLSGQEPFICVLLHGVTLTNISQQNVVVLLELILQRENGRLVSVQAHLDGPPMKQSSAGSENPSVMPAGVQIQRVATIAPRSAVTGFVVFRLTADELDGRFGISEPYRTLSELPRPELEEFGRLLLEKTFLRVTNQLDGSYRDYLPVRQAGSPARQFLNERDATTQAARRLTTEQRRVLIERLAAAGATGPIVVNSLMNDAEAAAYADEIAAALEAANWPNPSRQTFMVFPAKPPGVELYLRIRRTTPTPQYAVELVRAFEAAGLPLPAPRMAMLGDQESVQIMVGAKP